MSTLTFTGKQQLLRAKLAELTEMLRELFQETTAISWRTENGYQQTGTVVCHHVTNGRISIRVVDADGFFSVITVADILRAQP